MLLTQVETPEIAEDDELVSLNDELAENLVSVYGAVNAICAGNGACSNNAVCFGNGSCPGPNGICIIGDIPKPIDRVDSEIPL